MLFRLIKKIILVSLFSSLIFSCIEGTTKRALLIGIGKYHASTDWEQLHGDNDVQLLQRTLQKQAFKKRHIHTLTNEKASRRNIIKAIRKLIRKSNRGDIVVFHYSGHGQQIKDDTQEEVDGLDESIVPFDSPKLFRADGYKGEKLIRDDELYELFAQLRKKLGTAGHLLVILDACHSGTGTRGLNRAKGTTNIMASPEYIAYVSKNGKDKTQVEHQMKKGALAPMVAIFSSTAGQFSYEITGADGQDYGYLTYALNEYLNSLSANTSYQELMEDLRIFIHANGSSQIPILEGNPNLSVLGGSLLIPMDHYRVIDQPSSSKLRIAVGTLQHIYKGSKVNFYPKDTQDTSRAPLAKGEIVYTEAFLSEVQLDAPLVNPPPLKAFITEKSYEELNIKVKIVVEDSLLAKKISESLDTSFITIVNDQPDLLLTQEKGYIQVWTQNTELLLNVNKKQVSSDLLEICLAAAQAKALRQIELQDKRYKGTIQLIRTDKGEEADSLVFSVDKKEGFYIEIKNVGTDPFYFSIVGIQPNNKFYVLEQEQVDPKNIKLKSGGSVRSDEFMVIEPLGIEVLKLITSPTPLDLSALNQTKSIASRGIKRSHPLDFLLLDSSLESTVRGRSRKVRVGPVGIYTMVFQIKQ